MPLVLGTEGTTAIVTELTLRVWPQPKTRWLRGYRFSSVAGALDGMRQLMQGELWPSVVRLYDPVDTRIGGKTKPKKKDGQKPFYRRWLEQVERLNSVKRRSLALPLALPGLINAIFDKLASGCLLIVGWEGEPEVVEALSAAGHKILCDLGEDLGEEPGWRWFDSRHAVSYKLMPIFERGGFADTMEVATTWSNVEPLYEGMRQVLGQDAVVMAHMSHAYPEGCCIYFSFAGQGDREIYDRHWARALEAVVRLGGTVTHHHGVGELKAAAVSSEVGPAVAGWRELKHQLDPNGVLNPGRLFADAPDGPLPPAAVMDADGLMRVAVTSTLEDRLSGPVEPLWPWEDLSGPNPWHRLPWQTAWVEVRGEVDGRPSALGRAPRSASGPDLRGWLAERDPTATATIAAAPAGDRWMGEGTPVHPWQVAKDLLRADLRPAALYVDGATLRVGFRGPAASALGALAQAWVPGGLQSTAWQPRPLASGPLEGCGTDDEGVVAVLPQGALRRRS
jgi:hypothetical protein